MRTTFAVSRPLLIALLVSTALVGGSLATALAATASAPTQPAATSSQPPQAEASIDPTPSASVAPTEPVSVESPAPTLTPPPSPIEQSSPASPRATVTDGLTLTISGGLSHEVGDAITLTPGGSYPITSEPIDCEYALAIRSTLAPGVPFNVAPYIETYMPSVGGECPAWTLRLPNLADMAYFADGASTRVTIALVAVTGPDDDLVVAMSPHYDITFAPSSESVMPMSSLPVVFWQLDRGLAPAGSTVHASLLPVLPDGMTTVGCELSFDASSRQSCAPHFEVVAQSPNAQVDVFVDLPSAYTRSTIYIQGQTDTGG